MYESCVHIPYEQTPPMGKESDREQSVKSCQVHGKRDILHVTRLDNALLHVNIRWKRLCEFAVAQCVGSPYADRTKSGP